MENSPNVLVVGVGSIGERHVRCFLAAGATQISICEINADLRRQVAERYGIERSYPSLDEALAAYHQAAVIATPASLHIEAAQRLAAAGSHLLIEKPLSVTDDGVGILRQIIEEQRSVAAVAYVYRAHPALARAKQAIEEGRFGKPLELVAVSGQHFPTYRPAYRDTYYQDHATGGGAVQDALTHVINAAEWLVGPADQVVADVGHQALPGVSVEDTAHVLARHGNVLANYALNQYQAPNEVTITVICEEGTLRVEFHQRRWRWTAAPEQPWEEEVVDVPDRDALFVTQAQRFLEAAGGKCAPACTLAEGWQTLRCNLAILRSAEHGGWQAIPPVTTPWVPERT